MEYARLTALTGTLMFLCSGFLPWLTTEFFGITASVSLIDQYAYHISGRGDAIMLSWIGTAVYFLALIFFPFTVIVGFLSLIRRKAALAAGVMGIIYFVGSAWSTTEARYAVEYGSVMQYGVGIFVSLIGAVVLLISYFIDTREVRTKRITQPAAPPPPLATPLPKRMSKTKVNFPHP